MEALNRADLELECVTPVNLPVADILDALRPGPVEVAVLQEPFVTQLTKQAGASPVLDLKEQRLLPRTSYLYAHPQVLADPAKVEAIKQFLAAFVKAGKRSNEHDKDWAKFHHTDFQWVSRDDAVAILASQSLLVSQTSAEAIPHHQKLIAILHHAGTLKEQFDTFIE